jgi:beta-lactamase regulating signal transducer with metallopeptidase domain
MTSWLMDTLLYTGLLIALVLLLRRPVAREFGPRIAYALWALPVLRLLLPPVVLPASMAPAEPEASADAVMAMAMTADATAGPVAAPEATFEVADLLLPLWLVGAALFLAWRIATYLRMRRELLAEARPVGEVGRIRIVETPAVGSPVAFGVTDKVIALPPRFMAMEDRAARDLAIAHELEHHRGYDLIANFAAQPLLALHWFNPLAWFGWRAMRRDQEAACDARVLEGHGHEVRAAYAGVIAGFAAGPHFVTVRRWPAPCWARNR